MCISERLDVCEPKKPSLLARYTCVGVSCAVFSMWWKYSFVPESETPGVNVPIHSYQTTLALTVGYLVSLPILKSLVQRYCSSIDMKLLLTESMILYNVSQIALNGWMVWRFIDALMNRGHPFIGDLDVTATGTSYAVWIHYCDKYLEFFDTYFMVLRGRMDQVRDYYCVLNLFYAHSTHILKIDCFRCKGFFSSCLSSLLYCMGLVFCNEFDARRRCLLRCIVELIHSCIDVLLLCFGTFKVSVPMEKISH